MFKHRVVIWYWETGLSVIYKGKYIFKQMKSDSIGANKGGGTWVSLGHLVFERNVISKSSM